MKKFTINKDIKSAATITTNFYTDPQVFETSKEKIFARTWNYICDANQLPSAEYAYPFTFLKNVIDEPLLFTRDKNSELRCLSNVCTHRGNIMVEKAGSSRILSCGYHGRCFRMDGSFKSMPAFEDVKNFPTDADNLSNIPFKKLLSHLYISLNPLVDLETMIKPVMDRISWLPLETMKYNPDLSKNYYTDAHWALYCDNFLEGFHIPFVHPALNNALDFDNYQYEIFPYCNLQLGIADEGQLCFDIPKESQDYGKKILAYYFWLFPNLMFNFYPWGLSLNIVEPLGINKTKISFRSYVFEGCEHLVNESGLDVTEMEDEAIVESVQKGIRSRYYNKGRFSAKMEQGVHHFHQLIAQFMND